MFTMQCSRGTECVVNVIRGFTERPQAHVLQGMSRSSTLRSDGLMLNTCSSDALVEVLQHLKRSFWTYPWNTNEGDGGGFR